MRPKIVKHTVSIILQGLLPSNVISLFYFTKLNGIEKSSTFHISSSFAISTKYVKMSTKII